MTTSIDAATPQLKVIDTVFEAYSARDVNLIAPLLSKNYAWGSFPKVADLPDLTKEDHIELFGRLFERLAKLDVRVQHRRTIITMRFTLPLPQHIFHEVIEAPGKVVVQVRP